MKFNYREFLDDEVFKRLNEIKAFAPETVEAEAAMRKAGLSARQAGVRCRRPQRADD